MQHQKSLSLEWDDVEIIGPDYEDRLTLLELAKMTGNAYALPGRPNWYEVDPAWNTVCLYSITSGVFFTPSPES